MERLAKTKQFSSSAGIVKEYGNEVLQNLKVKTFQIFRNQDEVNHCSRALVHCS